MMSTGRNASLPPGAIDLHCHVGPSLWPRLLDAATAIQQASAAGMAGVVLKDHHRATFMEARILNERARPSQARAFGSVVLNESQGGLSPAAVEVALDLGARCVWMPTVSARRHQEVVAAADGPSVLRDTRRAADGAPIAISDARGALRSEVEAILRLVAQAGAILATGHLSVAETLAITERAHAIGVRAVVATHPFFIVGATDTDLHDLARAGAVIEIPASMLLPQSSLRMVDERDVRRWVELVGLRGLVLSSDLGQIGNPAPVVGLRKAVRLLRDAGFGEDEIRWLVVDAPRQLLGGEP